MNRIVVTPEHLRRAAEDVEQAARDFLEIGEQIKAMSFETEGQRPYDVAAHAASGMRSISQRAYELAYSLDPDLAALRMSAKIIEKDQADGRGVRWTLTVLSAAYEAIDTIERRSEHLGISRADAARALRNSSDDMTAFADNLNDHLGFKAAGKILSVAEVTLTFQEYWEESGHSLVDTTVATGMSVGGGWLGGAGGGALCGVLGVHPLVKGGCVLVGVVAGSWLGGEAADDYLD